jgi:hypothetical protein
MDDNGHQDPRLGHTSASNAEADERCAGRHRAQLYARQLLEVRSRPYAEFGTAIHKALAVQNPEGLDQEQLRVYEMCQQVEADILARYYGLSAAEAMQKCWRHQRLWWKFGDHEHSGEIDVGYRVGSRALLIEYKTLFGDVPYPSQNKQLRDQAVLFWKNFFLLDEIAVAVNQPLVTLKPEICIYDVPSLQRAELEMGERIAKSNHENPPRTAGESQCQWCEAKMLCKEYEVWATAKLPVLKADLANTPMASWTPEQWSGFCENLSAAQKWLEMGKEEAKERLKKDPASIPGFFLKPGRKVRTVVKVNELYARFEKIGGKMEAFHKCIEVVLGRLSGEIQAITGAKGKALDKALGAVLSGLIEENETAPSLARKKEKP